MREKNERGGLVDWNEGGRGRVEIVMLRGGQGGVFCGLSLTRLRLLFYNFISQEINFQGIFLGVELNGP
jgi:hypothetical protein